MRTSNKSYLTEPWIHDAQLLSISYLQGDALKLSFKQAGSPNGKTRTLVIPESAGALTFGAGLVLPLIVFDVALISPSGSSDPPSPDNAFEKMLDARISSYAGKWTWGLRIETSYGDPLIVVCQGEPNFRWSIPT
jgi:hypothetical protein